MTEIVKDERRNANGFKDMANMYRTIGGEHFYCWDYDVDPARVVTLRAAGVRVRRFGSDIYVHHADIEAADRAASAPPTSPKTPEGNGT